ncbi:hypothetical protein RQP46_009888 [Phenoliferia psychrophenolica]
MSAHGDQDVQEDATAANLPSRSITLPPELLAKIARTQTFAPSRERNATLATWAGISRAWSVAAYNELYGDLRTLWRSGSGERLLESFAANPALSSLVRKISIHYTNREEWSNEWLETDEGQKVLRRVSRYPLAEDEEESWEDYVRKRVSSEIHLAQDHKWILDDGCAVFWAWFKDLKNLQQATLSNFDVYDQEIIAPAASVLAGLRQLSIVGAGGGAVSHLRDIGRLEIDFSPYRNLKAFGIGPQLSHLKYLRIVSDYVDRNSDVADDITLVLSRGLVALTDLHISLTVPHVDLSPLISSIPSLLSLETLTLYVECTRSSSAAVLTPLLAESLAQVPLKHLRLRSWPKTEFLERLPRSVEALSIEDLDPIAAANAAEATTRLEGCLHWKGRVMPGLETLNVTTREVWPLDAKALGQIAGRAPGFEFRIRETGSVASAEEWWV